MEFKTNKLTTRRYNARGKPKSNGQPKNNFPERQPYSFSGKVADPVAELRLLPLFGLRTRRRLRYAESVPLSGAAAVVGNYVFSANGLFDPNITGTGHQPMGFDQMMVFYNHYTVIRSVAKVHITNTSTPATHVGLSIQGSSTVTTDYRSLLENGQIVYTTLTPQLLYGANCELKAAVNTASFQGIDNAMDDPDMRGDSASNPVEQLYFVLTTWCTTGAIATANQADVVIDYDCIFHEPRQGTIS